MPSIIALEPGTRANALFGVDWSSIANINTVSTTAATALLDGFNSDSKRARLTNWGFALPDDFDVVLGILVRPTFQRSSDIDTATLRTRIVLGGVNKGSVKASSVSSTKTTASLGGPTDVWSVNATDLEKADIESTTFGIDLDCAFSTISNSNTFSLFKCETTIYFSLVPPNPGSAPRIPRIVRSARITRG